MLEVANVLLGNDEEFDKAVHGGFVVLGEKLPVLRELGDFLVVTKDRGTKGGRPAVCFTFTVELPSGKLARVQSVITGRLFGLVAAAMRGRYGDGCDVAPPQ